MYRKWNSSAKARPAIPKCLRQNVSDHDTERGLFTEYLCHARQSLRWPHIGSSLAQSQRLNHIRIHTVVADQGYKSAIAEWVWILHSDQTRHHPWPKSQDQTPQCDRTDYWAHKV